MKILTNPNPKVLRKKIKDGEAVSTPMLMTMLPNQGLLLTPMTTEQMRNLSMTIELEALLKMKPKKSRGTKSKSPTQKTKKK